MSEPSTTGLLTAKDYDRLSGEYATRAMDAYRDCMEFIDDIRDSRAELINYKSKARAAKNLLFLAKDIPRAQRLKTGKDLLELLRKIRIYRISLFWLRKDRDFTRKQSRTFDLEARRLDAMYKARLLAEAEAGKA
jgi:hypothetical protein